MILRMESEMKVKTREGCGPSRGFQFNSYELGVIAHLGIENVLIQPYMLGIVKQEIQIFCTFISTCFPD